MVANGRNMDNSTSSWQTRDSNYRSDALEQRYTEYPRGRSPASRQQRAGSNPRYGGPPTPSSAHSRSNTRTPDHRRPVRGSSSERFSQHSGGRKASSRDSGGGRSSRGHGRSNTSYKGGGYASRSQHSPSSTEETTEETTETDSQAAPESSRNDYHRQMYGIPPPGYALAPLSYTAVQPQMMGPMAQPQLIMAPNGSIRSVQSVPMLAATAPTWDGEPCPVHHHHHHHAPMPLAALYGMGQSGAISMGPPSVPPSVISGATTVRRARSVAEISNGGYPLNPGTPHFDKKSFHGSMHQVAIPNGQGGTLIRGPPPSRVVVGENGNPSTLPMRDPKNRSPLPPKGEKDVGLDCCSGHFVVIWIILGIITFGILLGIVLKFTIA